MSLLLNLVLLANPAQSATNESELRVLASAQVLYEEQCAECHGYNGVSELDHYPNVARQKKLYLALELRNFKSGYRSGSIMPSAAERLTDEEIDSLALYMSKLKGK